METRPDKGIGDFKVNKYRLSYWGGRLPVLFLHDDQNLFVVPFHSRQFP